MKLKTKCLINKFKKIHKIDYKKKKDLFKCANHWHSRWTFSKISKNRFRLAPTTAFWVVPLTTSTCARLGKPATARRCFDPNYDDKQTLLRVTVTMSRYSNVHLQNARMKKITFPIFMSSKVLLLSFTFGSEVSCCLVRSHFPVCFLISPNFTLEWFPVRFFAERMPLKLRLFFWSWF